MRKKKPDPEWDYVFASNYRQTLLSSSRWLNQANALFEVADLLEPEVRSVWIHNMKWLKAQESMRFKSDSVFAIHFMLFAFGVENLLKGALVHSNYQHVQEEFERTGQLLSAIFLKSPHPIT